MARLISTPTLSIIIPCLNEAKRLPLLLADINLWPHNSEILIIDAGSNDRTELISKLFRTKFIKSKEPNRGSQLNLGASKAKGEWLLFLHADSRLPEQWPEILQSKMTNLSSEQIGWFFDLKIQERRLDFRLLELAVSIRSKYLKRPYGDQGLLINRSLYNKIGGYNKLYIMEDLDFILRISKEAHIKSLNLPIYTSGRKWRDSGVILTAWKNATLRNRWKQGECTQQLAKEYYSKEY